MKLRKDFTQANFNESNSNFLFGQIFVVSVALGLIAGSWWIFGISLIGLIVILRFKKVAVLVCFVFALAWGGLGIVIGVAFESVGASVVLAIIGFLVGLGGNLSGLQWARDVAGLPDDEDYEDGYDEDSDEWDACEKCGTEYVIGETVFCSKCGNKLPDDVDTGDDSLVDTKPSICPSCNAEIAVGAIFCAKCGSKL